MQLPKNIFFVAHIQKKDQLTCELVFFQRNKSLAGFVKCTSCVKYASHVKCAAAREGIYFISHRPKGDISQFPQGNYFTFGWGRIFHLQSPRFYVILTSEHIGGTIMTATLNSILNYLKRLPFERAIYFVCLSAICLISVKLILICFDKLIKKSKLDELIYNLLRISIKAFLLFITAIIVLSSLGISVSSLVATLSVVGVAFSLAVQGFLSNAFGGIQIISTKPFKIGDYIEVGSDSGLVHEVGLFYTKLNTFDKKLIQIPNGKIANETIINYTSADIRRVEVIVCLSYENEVSKVLSVLAKTFEAHPLVLNEEGLQPYAHVKEYQYSHICYTARAWCKTDDYWTVYFDTMDNLQASFAKNGVNFSYPHMNIHMVENKAVGSMTDITKFSGK